MRNWMLFTVLVMVCALIFAGCACNHVWEAANCESAQVCSQCNETKGEPLGHTPGEWTESADPVTCMVLKEQHCSVCDVLTESKTEPSESLVKDDLFVFTPEEFMERLTLIAEQNADTFTYEFTPSVTGLMVTAYSDGKKSLIQFFHPDATFASDEVDTADVWCVSLIEVNEGNADFRNYFFMACDPLLENTDDAFGIYGQLCTAYLNAAADGESLGYYEQNDLIYETSYIEEGTMGQDYSMNMLNVYASDFR